MQIDAYVLAVGDFQPEALPGIGGPPSVDAARLAQLVLGGRISEQDAWRGRPDQVRAGQGKQDRADK